MFQSIHAFWNLQEHTLIRIESKFVYMLNVHHRLDAHTGKKWHIASVFVADHKWLCVGKVELWKVYDVIWKILRIHQYTSVPRASYDE